GGQAGLGEVVDEGNPVGDETEPGELGQQAVADGFHGNTGTVGDIEHRSHVRHRHYSLVNTKNTVRSSLSALVPHCIIAILPMDAALAVGPRRGARPLWSNALET